jgi:protein-S-isoprenylcysteine O-methyltransferase Ste14
LVVAALGLLVEAAGAYEFVQARTTVDPTHPANASTLVTGGVYRFTRNPMYLGDMVMLVAWGLYLSNPIALAAAWLFVAYIDRFQIRAEERALHSLFGGVYEDFCARVRRWV